MDGLFDYDFSKKGVIQYKPALAQSIKTTDHGKTWEISLREDVYWSDGVPFNGQHVIDGWERVLNPETASTYSFLLFPVKNAREYNSGQIKDFSKVGIQLTSEGKLIVELSRKKTFLPFILTHSITFPIRKDIVQKHGSRWTLPQNIVTLGPYHLTRFEQDKLILLKKNPSYYGNFPGNAENVVISIIHESAARLNLYFSDKLDIVGALPSEQIPVLSKRKDFVSTPLLTTGYFGFNTKKPPLDNVKLRQAISMAIDKNQIIQILGPTAVRLDSWIPKGLFGHNAETALPYNPEKARQLLQSIGPLSHPVTISFNHNETVKRVTENIQAQLKKNLKLKVELLTDEWKVYIDNLKQGKMLMFRMGWQPDYPDPDTFMDFMASYSDNNYTGWGDPEYDRLIQHASTLPNGKERMKLYTKAQKIFLQKHAAAVPLFTIRDARLISPRVQHYPHNLMGKYLFKEIKLR